MKNKLLILSLCFSLFLTACNTEATNAADIKTAVLYAADTSQEVQTNELEYSGELTPDVLAKGLSDLTGLDFIINSTVNEDEIYVDWNLKSTLIANLDGREQKENFHFLDADTMRWSMMDSLWLTLSKNFNTNNIYYTMDGGKKLKFEDLYPIAELPPDAPYSGYSYYLAQAGGLPDETEKSDPGDTNQNEWWGMYKSDDLGFSIEITEVTETSFWFDIYLLRNGKTVFSGTATISDDDDHMATCDDVGFYLYNDFSAIDFLASESSEWAHMRGQYTKLED